MPGLRTRERGQLEGEVLQRLREHNRPLSARELQSAFTAGPRPAYTTLMTVLARLEKKGQVLRAGDSPRKIRFRAAQSIDQQVNDLMFAALDQADDRQAALLAFAGQLDAGDVALLSAAFGSPPAAKVN